MVGVRTVDGSATSPKDFEALDVEFWLNSGTSGMDEEVNVKICDDEGWEPDEDFFVEIYDKETGERLYGEDTRTRVTILDDDRPGMLRFAERKRLRHPADRSECIVRIERINGADGEISVDYETYELDNTRLTATPGIDYEHMAGTLNFKHREVEKEISIPILERKDLEKRMELFGIRLRNPQPKGVRVSRKDQLIIEIVTDAEQVRRDKSLQQLLDRINREEKITWKD